MPVNLPSLTELQNAQFVDPMFFGQVQNQIGLGNQFAQQGLEKGAADLQQQVLANLFAEQNNPQRVEQQRLQNEGLGYDNQSKGVQARTDVELEGESKVAKRAKLLASASDDDLKRLQAQAEAEMLNPDPAVQARGQKKLEGSWQELQRRAKAADSLKQAEAAAGGKLAVARIQQEGANERNIRDNETRLRNQQSKDQAALQKANGSAPNAEKAAVRAQLLADEADDEQTRAYYLDQARRLSAYSMALKNASAGTKIDMEQFGLQTNPVNVGVGQAGVPRPAGVPRTDGAGGPVRVPAATQAARDVGTVETLRTELRDAEASLAQAKRNGAPASAIKELETITDGLKREIGRAPAAAKAAAPAGAPAPGTVYKGYRFKGGNPADKSSWEKV